MSNLELANTLLHQFKARTYYFGLGISEIIPQNFFPDEKKIAIIRSMYPNSDSQIAPFLNRLSSSNQIISFIPGPKPNAPLDDLARIFLELKQQSPDYLVSFGGGSTTDITKAANVLFSLGGEIDEYFGTGLVSQKMKSSPKRLLPHLAIQTAASSSAHLTKYANITNPETNQKKLIVDEAIIPHKAIFDYSSTLSSPQSLTIDGALDGLSHSLEVYYGSTNSPDFAQIESVALESIRLILHALPLVIQNPNNKDARTALALGTDLGGYAIMLGGTNGGHLTSFSLVDVLSHGRACFLMNPYYTVFFAPAIKLQLQKLAQIFIDENWAKGDIPEDPHQLGKFVAQAMIAFLKHFHLPTSLKEVPGFTDSHIQRALTAAKNPQLKMKLSNMPIPFSSQNVDISMKTILLSAKEGDFTLLDSLFYAE